VSAFDEYWAQVARKNEVESHAAQSVAQIIMWLTFVKNLCVALGGLGLFILALRGLL
jgi:hypothetical protein